MSKIIDVAAKLVRKSDIPWEGIGNDLTPDGTLDVWKKESGLDFEVREAKVLFQDSSNPDGGNIYLPFEGKKVLYRSDTMKPLATVGKGYKVVQPGEVLDFFKHIADNAGFQMELAGSIGNGKRVWALAKVSEGANIVGTDRVAPYLMFATGFDGGLSTTAKFTTIRRECNNMLSMVGRWSKRDKNTVAISHSGNYDAATMHGRLADGQESWSRWLESAKRASSAELTPAQIHELTTTVALRTIPDGAEAKESKAYKSIMNLFNGGAIGSELTQGGTAWQWLNSVTEYVDHHKGRAADSRMNRAWFGDGDALKTQAFGLVEELLA